MLKFFFNREAWAVKFLNLLVFFEVLFLIWRGKMGWAAAFLTLSWLYFNALHWINWYPRHRGTLGIRVHFQRGRIPVVYLSFLGLGLGLLGLGPWVQYVIGVLFLPIYYVSFILLYFHFRDTSEMMPSYFSQNFYLRDKEPPCTP